MVSECMDNFKVHVIARSDLALKQAIELSLVDTNAIKAWGECNGWLILYWQDHQNHLIPLLGALSSDKINSSFPVALDANGVFPIIKKWLEDHPPSVSKPDLDGSCSKGFEILANAGDGWSYEAVRIRSIWAEHSK